VSLLSFIYHYLTPVGLLFTKVLIYSGDLFTDCISHYYFPVENINYDTLEYSRVKCYSGDSVRLQN
jgi:hypothetical protein